MDNRVFFERGSTQFTLKFKHKQMIRVFFVLAGVLIALYGMGQSPSPRIVRPTANVTFKASIETSGAEPAFIPLVEPAPNRLVTYEIHLIAENIVNNEVLHGC